MDRHPISLITEYAELARARLGEPFEFQFSKYVYVPQSVAETRKFFTASPGGLAAAFREQSASLLANEEIAFHSRVVGASSTTVHIPMIDMGCADIEPYLPGLSEAFHDFGIERFTVFGSGRSYHIYGHGLLAGDLELVRFMGRILLLNLPERERVIDERWVGHRLMAGYLTLRWTNNNPHYKSLPLRRGSYSGFPSKTPIGS